MLIAGWVYRTGRRAGRSEGVVVALISLQRFTLELRTLLSFSLDFLASSVGLVCDPRVNRCSV